MPCSVDDLLHCISSLNLSTAEKSNLRKDTELLIRGARTANQSALTRLLDSIKLTSSPTCVPLNTLAVLLSERQRQDWPVLDLIRCHTKLWKALPEAVKSGETTQSRELTAKIDAQVKSTYRSLTDLLSSQSSKAALIDPINKTHLTHKQLSAFISDFRLPISRRAGSRPTTVVLAIPNGPHLGLACLAVSTYYRAVPLNPNGGSEQFRVDVQNVGADVILVAGAYVESLELDAPWIAGSNIDVFVVEPHRDLTFSLTPRSVRQCDEAATERGLRTPNTPDHIALILFTSGTSGTKKLVPLTLHSIVSGVAFVVDSWALTTADCCLNMMPLHHVGGLIRNLFAPVLAGGSTICCAAFDPNLFWDVVEDHRPTWYYASPSMHSTILAEANDRPEAVSKSQIRLVCNAAGGLLPSLAVHIRDRFQCTVLPSYGMTECMPISTPPLPYQLDRAGTSGVSVGPELAVLDADYGHVPTCTVGNICVRGSPVFPGYLTAAGDLDRSAFSEAGWFNTGDMGYLNEDGYLYVTGRSKEVINRGGELISPLEVEEAIMKVSQDPESTLYGRIKETLIFSAPHDVLQEVVGVVLVTPPGKPRVGLRHLQEPLKAHLHQPKWPVVAVYMDGLPKQNNKVLRVKLGERLGFRELSDEMSMCERHFEAVCPPSETPLTTKIRRSLCGITPCSVIDLIHAEFRHAMDYHVIQDSSRDATFSLIVSPRNSQPLDRSIMDSLHHRLHSTVHGYSLPSQIISLEVPLPRTEAGDVDEQELQLLLHAQESSQTPNQGLSPTEQRIREIFSEILLCPVSTITPDSDFFELGGDSLRAGRLLSLVRKELHVRIPIETLFTNSTVQRLCEVIDDDIACSKDDHGVQSEHETTSPPGPNDKTYSSTNPLVLLVHLLPMALFFPMRRALQWTILLYSLSIALTLFPAGTTILTRLIMLLVCIVIAQTVTQILAPLFAIAFKWVVVGRYRAGRYPMWGPYHTRWWLVQKVLAIGGKGILGRFNCTRVLYYRLLGVKIGAGVVLDKAATLGEYDLLTLDDGVVLDNCIVRPFAVERNTTMYLGAIHLGRNCSVGLKSIVAPGSHLPSDTCIGPNSSSWEVHGATEANRDLSKHRIPPPHLVTQLVLGLPIKLIINLLALGPRAAGLVGLVREQPDMAPDMVRSVLLWFASPMRVGFHFLAYVAGAVFGPVVYLLAIIALKRTADLVLGKVSTGSAARRGELDKFRAWLLAELLPGGDLSSFTSLFGTHYDMTSWAVRALGGKVGKRVYWPGHGPSIQDFDLVGIGDDVVFGSRAHIVTSDGSGSAPVYIGPGSMVADRVVVLPGTRLERNVVLGSGALTRRDATYPADTVWVGSKNGEAVCLSSPQSSKKPSVSSSVTLVEEEMEKEKPQGGDSTPTPKRPLRPIIVSVDSTLSGASTARTSLSWEDNHRTASKPGLIDSANPPSLSPFGRAFYAGQAPYHVLGLPLITLYSLAIKILVTTYWNVTTVSTVQVLAQVYTHAPGLFAPGPAKPLVVYAFTVVGVAGFLLIQAVLALGVVVVAKWALLGRRAPGAYDWDASAYCQRWQVLLAVETLRRRCFGGAGVLGMLTGTHFAVLFFRALGASIGRDCALFAGGKPSLLFTEPDLLTLGDRVAVDDASLVGHVNSRGRFSLNRLSVGDRSALRSGSRLLSGAHMEADTCLLEHTLVMGGEVVERGRTYQGWPGAPFTQTVGDTA